MPYWIFLTNNALFGYFRTRIIKETVVKFKISTLKFVYLQNFRKKQKCLNLLPEMPGFGIFLLEFEDNIVIPEISTLEFV